MRIEKFDKWEEFQAFAQKLEKSKVDAQSDFLYRGQSRSEWELSTTLERYIDRPMSLYDYYRTMLAIRPPAQTFLDLNEDFISCTATQSRD